MKVTETIERECCEKADRRPYRGLRGLYLLREKMEFCIHCGQLWSKTLFTQDGHETYFAWEAVRSVPAGGGRLVKKPAWGIEG